MENKLSAPVTDILFSGNVRRHSSSCTPPRSPIFLIHKTPSSPGADPRASASSLENGGCSPTIRSHDRNSLSPFGRFGTTKKVCTMDCAHCRTICRNSRSESPNFAECLSAPCSRKSSVNLGKSQLNWQLPKGRMRLKWLLQAKKRDCCSSRAPFLCPGLLRLWASVRTIMLMGGRRERREEGIDLE